MDKKMWAIFVFVLIWSDHRYRNSSLLFNLFCILVRWSFFHRLFHRIAFHRRCDLRTTLILTTFLTIQYNNQIPIDYEMGSSTTTGQCQTIHHSPERESTGCAARNNELIFEMAHEKNKIKNQQQKTIQRNPINVRNVHIRKAKIIRILDLDENNMNGKKEWKKKKSVFCSCSNWTDSRYTTAENPNEQKQ